MQVRSSNGSLKTRHQITEVRYFTSYLLISLLSVSAIWAQGLTIRVETAEDGSDVAYAEVLLRRKSASDVMLLTDDNGRVRISEKQQVGMTRMEISSVGFQTFELGISDPSELPTIIRLKKEDEVLHDVVVTTQYECQSARRAVERIEIIDAKTLDMRSAFNLREAVMHRMNVQVRQDNSTGSAMSLMGISGQNVKILIDGVPVIGRLDGNIDLSQINMNDVERIEVIEGPVSTNYGTNALAGVINIITKKGKGTDPGGVDAYWESIGRYNVNVRMGKSFGKNNIRLSGGRNFFEGWTPNDTMRWDLWKPKEQYFGRATWAYTGKKFKWFYKSEYFNEFLLNRGRPLKPYLETAFDEEFRTQRFDQHLQFSGEVSKKRFVQGFIAYNHYRRDRNTFFKDLVELESEPVTRDGANDTTIFRSLRSRSTYSFSTLHTRLNYQLGYDAGTEWGSGLRIEGGEKSITDLALFGSAEFKATTKLTVKPGFRAAWNSSYKAPIVPMVAAKYKMGKYTIRGSWSQGFRAPDLKELYIFFVDVNHNLQGNPELKAETSNNLTFSVSGLRKLKKKEKSFLKPSVTAFYNHITDKINLANITSDLYTYVNIDEFKSFGGRVNLNFLNEKTRINTGFGYTAINNGINTVGNGYFGYTEFNAGIIQNFRGNVLSASMKYNGRQRIYLIDAESAEVTERETRDYAFLDIQWSRYFFKGHLKMNVGVKNLLNVGNIQSITASGGAHGSSDVALPVGTGRGYFVRMEYKIKGK